MCSRSERGGGRGQVGYADVVGGMVGAGGKCSGQAGGLGGPPPLMSSMDRGERGGGRGQVGCADIDVVGGPGRVGAGGKCG